MTKLIANFSRLIFKGLHATEAAFGLPRAISEPLRYREEWRSFLNAPSEHNTLWIHGSSVGELEDLANFYLDPLELEAAGYDASRLVVTSSSPSAKPFLTRLREKYQVAYAGPLPPENLQEIDAFLDKLRPELLILSHSDLWPALICRAQERALSRGILWMPAKASSAKGLFEKIVRPERLLAVGVRAHADVTRLKTRLQNFPGATITWVGNPRLDRIETRIAQQRHRDQHVLEESRARPDTRKLSVLIGSAWPEDAAVLAEALKGLSPALHERLQIVAIPHVTDDMHVVASIQHLLPMARILRIQGVLLEAYQDFDLAFVGGGYRSGLHSVLEPALWGLPIFCGPLLSKQPEATELLERGSLYALISPEEMRNKLEEFLLKPDTFAAAKAAAENSAVLLKASTGASKRLSRLVSESRVAGNVGK